MNRGSGGGAVALTIVVAFLGYLASKYATLDPCLAMARLAGEHCSLFSSHVLSCGMVRAMPETAADEFTDRYGKVECLVTLSIGELRALVE